MEQVELRKLSIDTIRALAMDAVQRANAGHPGTAMALAPLGYTLFKSFLRVNPRDPLWPDRDRFVLSSGHACVLQYALNHLVGYDLELADLEQFRQWGSRTPGHPERGHTPGVEVTTGPLGQGFGNAVGMALAERFLADRFNRPGQELVDHHAYPAPHAVDTAAAHGAALGEDEVRATKEAMGFDPDRHFWVDERVYEHMSLRKSGAAAQASWTEERLEPWRAAFPEEAADWD